MKISSKRIYTWSFIFIASLICLMFLSDKCPSEYENDFLVLVSCHIFMMLCMLFIISRCSFYIFEPIVFVIFMYYMIFVFTPIQNILLESVEIFGCNTMGGCIRATIIFMIGFVSMLAGYYFNNRKLSSETIVLDRYNKSSLLKYSWVVWMASIGLYLLYNQMIGRNVVYMLSFGLLSQGLKEISSFSVDFLSMIAYCAFIPMMNILIYGKSKIFKIIVFYVTCVPIATRGFRSVLIIPLMAPFIYSYVKKKKTPSLRILILVLAAVILMIGAISHTRSSLRVGEGMDFEGYSYSDGIDGVIDYFGSYKVYYGAVENYPSNYGYTLGKQLIYTITMYIPRALWPSKPSPAIQQVIRNSTNSVAGLAGAAWPNIGEYYTDFGIFGVIICMFILGIILGKMKKMYNSRRISVTSLVTYSLFLPALIPIVAYGYTAGNAPTFVFMSLPLLGQNYFVGKEYKK